MRPTCPFLLFFLFISFQSFSQQNIYLDSNADRLEIKLSALKQTIHICGLNLGHHYEVSILADDLACDILIQNQISSEKRLVFTALSPCHTLTIKKQCNSTQFATLSIADIDTKALPSYQPEDNLTVSIGFTPDELVQGVLIGNNCSIDLNVQNHGEAVQFGTFQNGMASIGFDSGIIISTGLVTNATGPNNSGSKGTNVPNNNTDPDLSAIATESTYDAAVLEFDFTPVSTTIEFEYVFASEEYCEFVNKDYNDVFGFFVSGPGISGTKNIARVPTSNEVVSIDNINHLKNQDFFYPNSFSCGGETNMPDIQFDGYTKPLTASITVIPCETYHIKLAISDVGDGIYDSAVFLKAGSFNAGDIVNITPKSSILQTQNSIEGCNNGYLVFDRSCSNDINQPLTLGIQVLGSSTAISGIDYTPLPPSITIPAGVAADSIPILALDDALLEGDETIIVEISGQYPCFKPTATIIISDRAPFQALGTDSSFCENTLVTLQPTPQGGFAPFSYIWSTGDTTSTLSQIFNSSELLTCTITDVCNNQSQASFSLTSIPASTGQISGNGVLCSPSSSSTINLNLTGVAPWDVTIERDGIALLSKQYTTTTNSFEVNQAGIYKIQKIESYGCIGLASGQAAITNSTLVATYAQNDVSCSSGNDGSITALPADGTSPYHYVWSNVADDSNAINGLVAGDYSFTVTDANGCTNTQSIILTEPNQLVFSVDSIKNVNCFSPQGGTVLTSTTGGTSPYLYTWSQGSDSPSIGLLGEGDYGGTVTDNHGCQDSIQVIITGDFVEPITTLSIPDTINCYHPEIILLSEGSSVGPIYSYLWTTTNGNILQGDTTSNPTIDQNGDYLLTIQNQENGCTSSMSVAVIIDQSPPTANAGASFALNCTDTTTILGAPNPPNNYGFIWTTTNGHFMNQYAVPQPIVDAPGLYYLLVTNLTTGCTNKDSVVVTEIDTKPDAASIKTIDPTCLGYDGSIEIFDIRGGTPPYLFSKDGGHTYHDSSLLSSLNPASYNIIIQDVYGCELQQEVSLMAPILPTLNMPPDYIIEMGDSIRLQTNASVLASDLDTIIWAPIPDINCVNCLTPFAKPLTTTEYWVTIIDSLHCEATAKVLVMVQDPDVYIPNIFSPKGEVQGNWGFTIFGNTKRIKLIKQLHIYDRWGNQIFLNKNFAPNNMMMGWDGEYREKDAPAGVYIYAAEIEFIDGSKKQYHGDVTLIR